MFLSIHDCWQRLLLVAALLFMCSAQAIAKEVHIFDMDEGNAEQTLKQFAKQAQIGILFNPPSISGVRTNEVVGKFTPRAALERMLHGTPLIFNEDLETGAFAVNRSERSVADTTTDDSEAPALDSELNPEVTTPMNERNNKIGSLFKGLLSLALASSPSLTAQDDASNEEEVFELSPFAVDGSGDMGYYATETLSGTRLRTNVREVGAAMTIMTKEFMEDMGVVSFEEALEYAPNTDTYETSLAASPDGPGGGTRDRGMNISIRGIRANSLSRDFFRSNYRSDLYNTERLTFSRGPNSILFGIGAAAGVTNSVSKRAHHRKVAGEVSFRFDEHGSERYTFDYNRPLVDGVLALRVAGLDYDTKYWYDPAYERGQRAHVALKLNPLANGSEAWKDLDINVSYEEGETESQRALVNEPVYDGVSGWIAAGRPLWDGPGNPYPEGTQRGFGKRTGLFSGSPVAGSDISNLPITNQARGVLPGPGDSSSGGGASLLDESIAPFDLDVLGATQRYSDEFDTFQVIVNKSFLDGDLNFEAAYNKQFYDRISVMETDRRSLRVDASRYLSDGVTDNPNAGKFFVDANKAITQPWGIDDQETKRFAVSYEMDFTKSDSWSQHLGKVRLAGSLESFDSTLNRQWTHLANVTPGAMDAVFGFNGRAAFARHLIGSGVNRLIPIYYIDPINGVIPEGGVSEGYPGFHEPLFGGDPVPTEIADPATGVTPHWVAALAGAHDLTEERSKQTVGQWLLFGDRVIMTYGKRWDDFDTWKVAPQRDPATLLFNDLRPFDPKRDFPDSRLSREGAPESKGIVAYPHRSIGLFYNESENFTPRTTQYDVYGNLFGNQTGVGKDYGIKFFVLDNKLAGSFNFYETSSTLEWAGKLRGNANPVANPIIGMTNRIWDTVVEATGDDAKYHVVPYKNVVPGALWGVTQDSVSEGVELQLTWNPTPNWRIMANFSEHDSVLSNVAPRYNQYHEEFVPAAMDELAANWAAYGVTFEDPELGEVPVATWQEYPLQKSVNFRSGTATNLGELVQAVRADVDNMKTLNDQADSQQPVSSANVVASYSFDQDSALKGFTVGTTMRWRDERFLGYGINESNGLYDVSKPYFGGAETNIDALIRYRKKLFDSKVDWSIQLNVRNVLNKDGLLPLRTAQDGSDKVVRWSFQTPRQAMLTNTFRF